MYAFIIHQETYFVIPILCSTIETYIFSYQEIANNTLTEPSTEK